MQNSGALTQKQMGGNKWGRPGSTHVVHLRDILLDSPTYPMWYRGIGRTVGYRAALGYWWDSIGQSHLSSMDMVQWNRTVDTWDMYMCMCKSSWYVVVQWSPVWEVYVPWYTRDPQVEYGILMADLGIPQAPIGLDSRRLRQQL